MQSCRDSSFVAKGKRSGGFQPAEADWKRRARTEFLNIASVPIAEPVRLGGTAYTWMLVGVGCGGRRGRVAVAAELALVNLVLSRGQSLSAVLSVCDTITTHHAYIVVMHSVMM